MSEPRIRPLPPGEWPPEMAEAIAALRPAGAVRPPLRREGRPKGLNALGTLAVHPTLARAFNTFNGHILFTSTLSERQRELLVLRTAAVRQCPYEWAQHAVLAGDVGFADEEIERITVGADAPGWSDIDGAFLHAVDEFILDGEIGDATWSTLATELDEQQLMDLVFTVGAYDLLARVFNSVRIELDDDLRK